MEDWEEDLMVGSYDPTQNAMLKGVLRFPLGLYSKKEKKEFYKQQKVRLKAGGLQ